MTAEPQQVIVCGLLDGQEMRGIAQAALEESIALVTLDESPPDEEFVLELHAPGTRPVVVLAVTAVKFQHWAAPSQAAARKLSASASKSSAPSQF